MASKDFSKYMQNPTKLLDMLDALVGKMAQHTPPEESSDKVLQFNEICKTIERLKGAGAVVPAELRRLKIELSHDVEEYEKKSSQYQTSLAVLQELELRLGNSLTQLRAVISRLKSPNAGKAKSRRYVKRTSPAILAKELRKALRELGGSGKKADVLRKMRDNMEGKFKVQDLERDPQGNLNWERWAVAEKSKMTREGVIKAGSSFGIWELRRK